jgi:hypothetical protein
MPKVPVYYPVTWQKQETSIVLPVDQAKNLLKNKALMTATRRSWKRY